MIGVGVVEHHTLVRQSLVRLLGLEDDLTVLGECTDTDSALDLVSRHAPDVLVIDLDLPDGDALRAISMLRQRPERVGVVVVGSTKDDRLLRATLRLQVDGHVMKDDPTGQLVTAIRIVAAGGTHRSPTFERSIDQLAAATSQPPPDALDVEDLVGASLADLAHRFDELVTLLGSPRMRLELEHVLRLHGSERRRARLVFDDLTPREREVLLGLVEGRCAQTLANEAVVSLATVRSQIRSVLTKLGVTSQLEAVALARRVGWPTPEGSASTDGPLVHAR